MCKKRILALMLAMAMVVADGSSVLAAGAEQISKTEVFGEITQESEQHEATEETEAQKEDSEATEETEAQKEDSEVEEETKVQDESSAEAEAQEEYTTELADETEMIANQATETLRTSENKKYKYVVLDEQQKTARLELYMVDSHDDTPTITLPSEVDGYKIVQIYTGLRRKTGSADIWSVQGCTIEDCPREGNHMTLSKIEKVILPNTLDGSTCLQALGRSELTNLREIEFAAGSTIVPNQICSGLSVITKITMPDSVKVIGDGAFNGCTGITSVEWPSSLEEIRSQAFKGSGLESLILPRTVKKIGGRAFAECHNLTGAVTFPKEFALSEETKTEIDGYMFEKSENLKKIVFENGMTFIPKNACADCDCIEEVSIPETVLKIERDAFYNCIKLTNVVLPGHLTAIGEDAFYSTSQLATINLPDSITTIGDSAFCRGGVKEITLPKGLIKIYSNSFNECTSLEKVTVPKELSASDAFTGNHHGVFEGCTNLKTAVFEEGITETPAYIFEGATYLEKVELPNTLLTIASYSFTGTTALKKITLPDSLTSIKGEAFSKSGLTELELPGQINELGWQAFYQCNHLTEVVIPESLKTCFNAFVDCENLAKVTFEEGMVKIPDDSFKGVKALNTVVIPNTVEEIGASAFEGTVGLTSINLPSSVKQLDGKCFAGSGLKTFSFSSGLKVLKSGVFEGCKELQGIIIPSTLEEVGAYCFSGCTKLTTMGIEVGTKKIPDYTFSEADCLENIDIPITVEEIGKSAFHSCVKLKEIKLTDSVKTIGSMAFSACDGLTEVTIPKSVTSMTEAFYQCKNLTKVVFASGMSRIPAQALSGAESVTEVSIPLTARVIGNQAFAKMPSMQKFELPDDIEEIEFQAFSNNNFREFTLPKNLEKIGSSAFADCKALTKITIPHKVMKIDTYTFQNCEQLSQITFEVDENDGCNLKEIPEAMFHGCKSLKELEIPAGVERIGHSFIYYATSLTKLVIPASVETIDGYIPEGSEYVDRDKLVVYGAKGSAAEKFATDSNLKFQAIAKPCERISVYPSTLTLLVGKDYKLTPHIWPMDCTDTITWSSSNTDVAEVTALGYVVANGPGEATITAKCGDAVGHTVVTVKEQKQKREAKSIDDLQTPHPYPAGLIDTVVFDMPSVELNQVYFSDACKLYQKDADDTASDRVTIYECTAEGARISEKSYTGTQLAGLVLDVKAPKMEIEIISVDSSDGACYGYKVEKIQGKTGVELIFEFCDQGATASCKVEAVKGEKFEKYLPKIPSREGYVFLGWYTQENGQGESITDNSIVSAKMTLYAHWMKVENGLVILPVEDQYYTGVAIKPSVKVLDSGKVLSEGIDYTLSYSNNVVVADKTAAKKPTVVISGTEKYPFVEKAYFNILPKNLCDEEILVNEDKLVKYAGNSVQKLVPELTLNGKKLRKNIDYKVFHNETGTGAYKAVGTYEVTLEGCGNFGGIRKVNMQLVDKVAEHLMSDVKIIGIQNKRYLDENDDGKGDPVVQKLTVTYKGQSLNEGEHYYLKYSENNGEIGTVTMTFKGISPYVGTVTKSFKITGTEIKKVVVSGIAATDYKPVYDGTEKKPTITVSIKSGGTTQSLTEGKDYELLYSNNVNAGQATVTLNGKGAYSGSVQKKFKIAALNIASEKASNSSRIQIADEDSLKVFYAKNGVMPKVVVTFGDKTLTEGKDYKLSATNNKVVADKQARKVPMLTITGKGNYVGAIKCKYEIMQKNIGDADLVMSAADLVAPTVKNKWMVKPVLTDVNGKKLAANVDYKAIEYFYVKYANGELAPENTPVAKEDIPKAGTVIKVRVQATDKNYVGTKECTYRILEAGKDISKYTFRVTDQFYTGKEVFIDESQISAFVSGSNKAEEGCFEIVEETNRNHIARGKHTITVRGVESKGYGGTKVINFKIVEKQ